MFFQAFTIPAAGDSHIEYVHGSVIEKLILLVVAVKSFTPSNTMLPLLPELKAGPFTNVPLFPLPLKSFQIVPEPGYDLVLAASK